MRWRHARLLVASIALVIPFLSASCANDEARVSFSRLLGFDGREMQPVRVVFSDGKTQRELAPAEFPSSSAAVGPYKTENDGQLTIEVYPVSDEGAVRGQGRIVLPLREDWQYGISIGIRPVGSDDPSGCFGCMGAQEFELDPLLGYPPTYRLLVIWGGNSISHPVVY